MYLFLFCTLLECNDSVISGQSSCGQNVRYKEQVLVYKETSKGTRVKESFLHDESSPVRNKMEIAFLS